MEDDDGAYANSGLLYTVNAAEYAGVKILAVPRCCQKRKGTTDRKRINNSVEIRDSLAAGVPWEDIVERLRKRGDILDRRPSPANQTDPSTPHA